MIQILFDFVENLVEEILARFYHYMYTENARIAIKTDVNT